MSRPDRNGGGVEASAPAGFWAEAEKDLFAGIDTSAPNSARVWDRWRGGKDNYPVDRAAADRFRKTFPGIVDVARQSRYFLARAVRYLAADAGVRQFLDIGVGLPAVDNTHEVAQRIAPAARVVYVDVDPMVLSYAQALLTSGPDNGAVGYVDADVRDPDAVVKGAAGTLDLAWPVAVVLVGVLGHVGDDGQARSITGRLLDGLPPGSYLVVCDGTDVLGHTNGGRSHGQPSGGQAPGGQAPSARESGQRSVGDGAESAHAAAVREYNDSAAAPYYLRSPARIAGLFGGLRLVDPGVVSCSRWRPDPGPFGNPMVDAFGGVGRR